MRRNASSASKGSHRSQRRRILKETAMIYPNIIMVIIMQPHRWDKTLRWRGGGRWIRTFGPSQGMSQIGRRKRRFLYGGTDSSNPVPSSGGSGANLIFGGESHR